MNVTQFGLWRLVARHGSLPLEVITIVIGAMLCAVSPRLVCAQGQTEVVAVTGDQVVNSDERFVGAFAAPVINGHGEVAFVGQSQVGTGRRGGPVVSRVYRGRRGSLTRIYEGSVWPNLDLNDAGQVSFSIPDNFDRTSVLRGDGVTLDEVASVGQPAPGLGTFGRFYNPTLNNAGQTAFSALVGRGTDGVFRSDGSTVVAIAHVGQATPEIGGTFRQLVGEFSAEFLPLSMNELGQVAFQGGVDAGEPGFDDEDFIGIFRGDGTSVTRIAQIELGPPFTIGVNPQAPLINDAGQVAYIGDVVDTAELGVFLSDGATPTRVGDAAERLIGLNNAGQVLLLGETASGRQGLFRGGALSLVSIAEQADDGDEAWLEGASLNEAGQVAFLSKSCGLCLFDDALGFVDVARVGDSLLGSTITDLDFRGSVAGEPGALADTGIPRVAYSFTLGDGRRGVAVWSLVPEPGSVLLVGLAMVGLGGVRVRRRNSCRRFRR